MASFTKTDRFQKGRSRGREGALAVCGDASDATSVAR
jgi:hypothetical protein